MTTRAYTQGATLFASSTLFPHLEDLSQLNELHLFTTSDQSYSHILTVKSNVLFVGGA